jgi:hypothetical protein
VPAQKEKQKQISLQRSEVNSKWVEECGIISTHSTGKSKLSWDIYERTNQGHCSTNNF